MAITKVSRGLLNTGVSDSSDATAITINSSEQVGIGTTSPVATLQVKTQADGNLAFQNSTSVTGGIKLNCFNDAANASSPFEIDGSSLQFNIAASEKMRIDSSGNVGIGTTPASGVRLDIRNDSTTTIADLRNANSSGYGLYVAGGSSSSQYALRAADKDNNALFSVMSSGNVGIGVTAPANLLQVKTTVDGSGLTIQRDSTTAGTYGQLSFINTTTDNYTAPAWIRAYRNSAGVNAGEMTFGTAGSERMRIRGTNGDILLCKTVDTFSTAGIQIQQSTGRSLHTVSADNVMDLNRTTSHGVILGFYLNGSSVGTISTNANNLPSDRNFKRDISDLDLGLNLVTKLKPSQYNYKIDSEDCPKMYGLIAQDLEQALEEEGVEKNSTWLLQHEPKNDENQSDYALDYQKLTPILIKAIQEQQAIIEDLQTQINEVKNGN